MSKDKKESLFGKNLQPWDGCVDNMIYPLTERQAWRMMIDAEGNIWYYLQEDTVNPPEPHIWCGSNRLRSHMWRLSTIMTDMVILNTQQGKMPSAIRMRSIKTALV